MDLKSTIQNDIKAAMKEKDAVKVDALRLLMAEIKKREIDAKAPLSQTDIFSTINSLLKQRADAVDAYTKGDRPDLADKERREMDLLQKYLPEPLSDQELQSLIRSEIQATGATSPKDMGKVMKGVLAKVEGRADGKRVSQAVQALLSGK